MRKTLIFILISSLLVTAVSCRETPDETSYASDVIPEDGFDPHVYSELYDENFDAATKQAFFSFCDALLAGEDEFDCPDYVTFYNVSNTVSHQCMPLSYFVDDGACSVSGGKGHIVYTIPREEYMEKVEAFKDIVTSMLDECIKDGYSDTDKALAIYHFFEEHYVYDYYAAENDDVRLSPFRLFYDQKGICQEIAPAYAYMLLQAGVECTTCGSLNASNDAHEWAVAKLDGRYYHIDPTWAVCDPGTLRYFGMTDDQRVAEGGWERSVFNYGEANIFDTRGELSCVDSKFAPLWVSQTYEIDYEADRISYYTADDPEEQSFVY